MNDAVVVGAGVVGLTTACELLAAGLRVAIWSRDDPATTTSAVAAAIWYPYLCEPRERVRTWSAVTWRRLRDLAADPETGVRMVPTVELLAADAPTPWWADSVLPAVAVPASALPPGRTRGLRVEVPLADTTRHLPWLVAQARRLGAAFVHRTVTDLEQAFAEAPVVVNCTGLGARALCADTALRPVRGQVVVVDRVEVPHAVIDDTDKVRPLYVLPRTDDLVLGGTAQQGREDLAVDADDTAAIVARCTQLLPALRGARVRAVKVGLRPFRTGVRLETERRPRGLLVHNYGHGGAGYTLGFGCAAEVLAYVRGTTP